MTEDVKDQEAFLARIDVRLRTWRRLWMTFAGIYFFLGILSVSLSAFAATGWVCDRLRSIFSVVAATSVALLGFIKPETRYRNLVRAWRELDAERTRYLYGNAKRERLLQALVRAERMATDDESQPKELDAEGSREDIKDGREK